mgnify:CR=1 FL=1
MAILQDLISQIEDKALRDRILQETNKLFKQKKFGLVFEEHLPECTPLYEIPIRVGSNVALKTGYVKDIYTVINIDGDNVTCYNKEVKEEKIFNIDELVVIAQFGEPIYPYLKHIDSVCNAPDSDLWHTLIEADNYHALQLLEYLYAGKVDCIYIDPPYNTGARDWKYNNDYVDNNDAYRHSKWLSMMEKRLKLAKKLLNPQDSVLIVTIDEKEYLHLGCLLEELFPDAKIQMISNTISRKGIARTNEFTRVDEYIFFVMIGNYLLAPLDNAEYALEGESIHWQTFRRSNAKNIRTSRPRQFYPIYVDTRTNKIIKIGDILTPEVNRFEVEQIEHCVAVFPVRDDGTEMLWGVTQESCVELFKKGYIKASKYTPNAPQLYIIQYLMEGTIRDIDNGKIQVTGRAKDGSIIASNLETKKIMPRTQWNYQSHDARDYGTKILKQILNGQKFDFPKSLYAVRDSLLYFLVNKPNALVVDFFAGSGTTLHSINLLNAEDNGSRRCILVTNNEVSEEETLSLIEQGLSPGDADWEKFGIARYVTWPRTVGSILGKDINGNALEGFYGVDKEEFYSEKINIIDENGNKKSKDIYLKKKVPIYPNIDKYKLSGGFKANAIFFKLGFLDKTSVALGKQFKNLLSVLWMKAGAHGECPVLESDTEPDMLILPQNKFAVLTNEMKYSDFAKQINNNSEIETIYIVTDSENSFKEMINGFEDKQAYQLYRDYLDNFRINIRG